MGWAMTLAIGGVIGWLAGIVMKTSAQMSLIANVLVGIVGSLLGSSVNRSRMATMLSTIPYPGRIPCAGGPDHHPI